MKDLNFSEGFKNPETKNISSIGSTIDINSLFESFIEKRNAKGEIETLKSSMNSGKLAKILLGNASNSTRSKIRNTMNLIEEQKEPNIGKKFFFCTHPKSGVWIAQIVNTLEEKNKILSNPKLHVPLNNSVIQG